MERDYGPFRKKITDDFAFDWWIAKQNPAKTHLIRHSYGVYQGGQVIGYHAFLSRERFAEMCAGAAIFHKDAFGTVSKWVGPGSTPVPLPEPPRAEVLPVRLFDPHQSETSKHRHLFLPHLPPCNLLDIGYGGDPVAPWAVGCDMAQGSYTHVGAAPQQLGFDCRTLPFKDGTLQGIYSSHVIEDFSYEDQVKILQEWFRCLRRGGVVALLQPDQKRFEAHCAATGQSLNEAHKERDYSLATFKSRVWNHIRAGMALVEARDLDDYSWMFVAKKI